MGGSLVTGWHAQAGAELGAQAGRRAVRFDRRAVVTAEISGEVLTLPEAGLCRNGKLPAGLGFPWAMRRLAVPFRIVWSAILAVRFTVAAVRSEGDLSMMWLAIWIELSLLAGLEIGRVLGWGNPMPSEPEPAAGVAELPQHTSAALIREVLARGRADGLDTRQLAGAVTVVLESHGLLQREAAA